MHRIGRFLDLIAAVASADDLLLVMAEVCRAFGFDHFALTQHVDIASGSATTIHLHNYPEQWAAYYEANALGVSDPVHRASHLTSYGFHWSRLTDFIKLTAADTRLLAQGRLHGIGDGYTVPANVPGEVLGSCTFANRTDRPIEPAMTLAAQLAGQFAFEQARRVWAVRRFEWQKEKGPMLTDRQRDCVLWAARGKGDWEIARILGVSEETVASHIKQACERYGVHKRSFLAIRTLADGTLTFSDVLKR
jgi:DNA-binding CsgD family transcriptional regulator